MLSLHVEPSEINTSIQLLTYHGELSSVLDFTLFFGLTETHI